jgi:PHD/YefM family antitoxin component YafN of YafNO toxin-antitoxin module
MNVYTYSEARQKLATLLDKAAEEGEVRIRRRDGQVFIIKPQTRRRSPLEVDGPDLKLTLPEILQSIQEGRKSY